jgi:hypothetical protein
MGHPGTPASTGAVGVVYEGVTWPACTACGRALTYHPDTIGTHPHYRCSRCHIGFDASLLHTFWQPQ